MQFSVGQNFSKVVFLNQMDSFPCSSASFLTISCPSPYIKLYHEPAEGGVLIMVGSDSPGFKAWLRHLVTCLFLWHSIYSSIR